MQQTFHVPLIVLLHIAFLIAHIHMTIEHVHMTYVGDVLIWWLILQSPNHQIKTTAKFPLIRYSNLDTFGTEETVLISEVS